MKKLGLFLFGAGLFALIGMLGWANFWSPAARRERALNKYAQELAAPSSVTHFPAPEEMPGDGPFRQARWFKLIWMSQRLDAWIRRSEDHGAVVFAGDSITQQWLSLAEAFPKYKTANRGIAGDTSRGLLYRFEEDVLQLAPRAVVLLCGINDLSEGAMPATVAKNTQKIMALCQRQNPPVPLIICTVLPVDGKNPTVNKKVQELNIALNQLAELQPNVWVADTWTALADSAGAAQASDFPDLLHPNKRGYAKLITPIQELLEANVPPSRP